MKTLKYIELKTGGHSGPAYIGYVQLSKSRKTIYFYERALLPSSQSVLGNYIDIETREEYWVSNAKKAGGDRHKYGSGEVLVQRAALADYLSLRGLEALPSGYRIVDISLEQDISRFHTLANEKL